MGNSIDNDNFISSKDSDEIRTMHTKSNNIEIMIGNERDKIIEELFESLAKISRRIRRKKLVEMNLFLIVLIYCITIFIT